jgi:phosphomethylpyrimidine synthase
VSEAPPWGGVQTLRRAAIGSKSAGGSLAEDCTVKTQLESAREGVVTKEVIEAASREGLDPEALSREVAAGRAVVPANLRRPRGARDYFALGGGSSAKVNANIGTSRDSCDLECEIAKLRAAEEAGAESVMDLSTAGDLRDVRRKLISATRLLFGTVPIYEAAVEAAASGSYLDMTPEAMLDAVRRHAEDGVDFVTVHAGVTRRVVQSLGEPKGKGLRVCGIVSRGGTFLARWMARHGAENPFFERFDELLDIAHEHDLVLSLGDGLRPGALADAGDAAQLAELIEISALVERARDAGVQVIVEGPGHVPLNEVRSQIETAKKLALGAPLYVLGPLVTDSAAGHDHVAAAIGGALACWAGADFLCVVTPSEHLSLPGPAEIREGVIAAKVAAHAADVARGLAGAARRDLEVSRRRRARDWEGQIALLLDPEGARRIREASPPGDPETCSMCGPYCVFREDCAEGGECGGR